MKKEHLAYISLAAPGLDNTAMEAILEHARRNNLASGITGHLQWHGRYFFQVLEGPAPALDTLLEKLHNDTRHSEMNVLFRAPLPRRNYAAWSMGYGQAKPGKTDSVLTERLERLHRGSCADKNHILVLFHSLMSAGTE